MLAIPLRAACLTWEVRTLQLRGRRRLYCVALDFDSLGGRAPCPRYGYRARHQRV